MGYRLNRLDELVFMAGPKSMQTEFGIHHRRERIVFLLFQTGITEANFDGVFVNFYAMMILDYKKQNVPIE